MNQNASFKSGLGRVRTCGQSVMSRPHTLKLLNKMTVSELAELSKLSKSYISQVKNGKRPPSEKLIEVLVELDGQDNNKSLDCYTTLQLFLRSRREGISQNTLRDYRITLSKSLNFLGLTPTTKTVSHFFNTLPCSLGGKYGYFKCIRAFYNWLYSPKSALGYKPEQNPITWVEAPKRPILILPSLTKEQVDILINQVDSIRDKAIIALFTESGLRLSELTNIKLSDINWQSRIIRVLGKGNKEGLAPFGELSEVYLKQWLAEHTPNGNIWGDLPHPFSPLVKLVFCSL